MSEHIKRPLQVPKLGNFECVITSDTHVCINSVGELAINGIPYRASAHFYLKDNEWKPGDYNEIYVRRLDGKDWSFPALNKFKAAIEPAWLNFIKSRPELLKEAALAELTAKIEKTDEEIANTKEELGNLANQKLALQAALDQLRRN